jgi:hypothetical protein
MTFFAIVVNVFTFIITIIAFAMIVISYTVFAIASVVFWFIKSFDKPDADESVADKPDADKLEADKSDGDESDSDESDSDESDSDESDSDESEADESDGDETDYSHRYFSEGRKGQRKKISEDIINLEVSKRDLKKICCDKTSNKIRCILSGISENHSDHEKLNLCEYKLNSLDICSENKKNLLSASIEYGSFKRTFLISIKCYITMHAVRTVKHIALFQTMLKNLTYFESEIKELNQEFLVVENKACNVDKLNQLEEILWQRYLYNEKCLWALVRSVKKHLNAKNQN